MRAAYAAGTIVPAATFSRARRPAGDAPRGLGAILPVHPDMRPSFRLGIEMLYGSERKPRERGENDKTCRVGNTLSTRHWINVDAECRGGDFHLASQQILTQQ
jgi:hypothetical protein